MFVRLSLGTLWSVWNKMHPVNLTTNRQYLIPAPFPVIAFFYIKTDKIYISMFPVKISAAKLSAPKRTLI